MGPSGLETALNADTGAPEWVQLIPPGPVIAGRDGRRWRMADPNAVLRAFKEAGVDLAIDYEHAEDDPTRRAPHGPQPAAGWIKELRYDTIRGLMGRVTWTATARQLIESTEYRYLSPTFRHTRDGVILDLLGAGLVHRPNFPLKALARKETEPMPEAQTDKALSRIAAALGLDQTADEAAILTAINSAQSPASPDPAHFVPIEAVRELMAERALSKATASEEVAHARVEAAMNAGYLTPGMRDWAVALCRADPASFDAFVQKATPAYAHLFEPAPRLSMNSQGRQSARNRAASAEEAEVFTQLGLDPSGKA